MTEADYIKKIEELAKLKSDIENGIVPASAGGRIYLKELSKLIADSEKDREDVERDIVTKVALVPPKNQKQNKP